MKPVACPCCGAALSFDADAEVFFCATCEGAAPALVWDYADEVDARTDRDREEASC